MLTFAILNYAKVAQLVERDLAKVEVASSNLVFRSKEPLPKSLSSRRGTFFEGGFKVNTKQTSQFVNAQVVELVDTQDLKSCVHCGRIGSSPIPGTRATSLSALSLFFFPRFAQVCNFHFLKFSPKLYQIVKQHIHEFNYN